MEHEIVGGVSLEDAVAFLLKHPDLLGSIVAYDEIDTSDRAKLWEYCRWP